MGDRLRWQDAGEVVMGHGAWGGALVGPCETPRRSNLARPLRVAQQQTRE